MAIALTLRRNSTTKLTADAMDDNFTAIAEKIDELEKEIAQIDSAIEALRDKQQDVQPTNSTEFYIRVEEDGKITYNLPNMKFRGVFNEEADYSKYDLVVYQDAFWFCAGENITGEFAETEWTKIFEFPQKQKR